MSARLIHVGEDQQFRVLVLEKAGFLVDICTSMNSFQSSIIKSPPAIAALITGHESKLACNAASLARTSYSLPLIYFEGESAYFSDFDFDLTIPRLTPPHNWIAEVQRFIQEGMTLRAQLKASVKASEKLKASSALLRAESAATREVSRRLCDKIDAARKPGGV